MIVDCQKLNENNIERCFFVTGGSSPLSTRSCQEGDRGCPVCPGFKTMKSEFVTCQETIRAKKYDLYYENQNDQPEGSFTETNLHRSRQTWVKTFIQDVMDEKGQVLFDNLVWFTSLKVYGS
jgi:hypothetical protein